MILNHYITQYIEDGKHFAAAWIQVNLFGKCFCLSKRKIEIHEIEDRQA